MGMFDELVPFSENFNEGEFFKLLDVKIGNEITTEYGDGTPVQLKIATDEGPKWFSAFGQALVNQVSRMEPGDLPCEVALVRQSNKAGKYDYKVLATQAQVEAAATA